MVDQFLRFASGPTGFSERGGASMSRPLSEVLKWTETDPDSARIDGLVARLADEDGRADDIEGWPAAL